MLDKFKKGQWLWFTKDLPGACPVKATDKLIYLGNSQARIMTGESKGWLVYLMINSPVSPIKLNP